VIISECNISLPFVLFADCEVSYCGRAESSLVRGKYLVVRKVDGSFLIMGGVLVTPLNYQGRGGVLVLEGDVLVCRRLGEVLRVRVFGVEFFRVLGRCLRSFRLLWGVLICWLCLLMGCIMWWSLRGVGLVCLLGHRLIGIVVILGVWWFGFGFIFTCFPGLFYEFYHFLSSLSLGDVYWSGEIYDLFV